MTETTSIKPTRIPTWSATGTAAKAMAVSVRWASTETDARTIAAISRAGFTAAHQKAFTTFDLTDYLADTFNRHQIIAEMSDLRTRFLVAEVAGVIAGTVRLRRTQPPHPIRLPAALELSRLYLKPQWVGRGVGSTLMQQVLKTAVTAGFKSCWLAVWEGNSRAIEFYRRWDFRFVGTDTLPVGQSCPTGLIMARIL